MGALLAGTTGGGGAAALAVRCHASVFPAGFLRRYRMRKEKKWGMQGSGGAEGGGEEVLSYTAT
jgi:hypothetical protein